MVYDDGFSCHLKWIIMTNIADLNIIVIANDMQGRELAYSMSQI